MSSTIVLPTALRAYCDNQRSVDVSSDTVVDDALQEISSRYPELREHLFDSEGSLLGYVNVFVNQHNIRDLENGKTPISKGDEILIVPALAGG